MRKPDSIRAIDIENEEVARIIAIDRVIDYIKQGKITINGSYNFQDMGKRIKEVQFCENDGFLSDKIREQLIRGEFPVNFWSLLEATKYSKMDEEDDSIPPAWNNLSEVLHFISEYVRENTPGWFDEHKYLFREQTEGMFSIESNHLKKKVRILEGNKARIEMHNAGLSLIAAELVISVAGLYHVLNGWSGPESPFNLSDIRLYIPA